MKERRLKDLTLLRLNKQPFCRNFDTTADPQSTVEERILALPATHSTGSQSSLHASASAGTGGGEGAISTVALQPDSVTLRARQCTIDFFQKETRPRILSKRNSKGGDSLRGNVVRHFHASGSGVVSKCIRL